MQWKNPTVSENMIVIPPGDPRQIEAHQAIYNHVLQQVMSQDPYAQQRAIAAQGIAQQHMNQFVQTNDMNNLSNYRLMSDRSRAELDKSQPPATPRFIPKSR